MPTRVDTCCTFPSGVGAIISRVRRRPNLPTTVLDNYCLTVGQGHKELIGVRGNEQIVLLLSSAAPVRQHDEWHKAKTLGGIDHARVLRVRQESKIRSSESRACRNAYVGAVSGVDPVSNGRSQPGPSHVLEKAKGIATGKEDQIDRIERLLCSVDADLVEVNDGNL